MLRRLHGATLLLALLAACVDDGSEPEDPTNAPTDPCDPLTPEERAANQAVFDALSPHCAGCHASGAKGYFASITAFEALVVYDEREVVAGDPDASELVRLLEGQGTRGFAQMPIAGQPYAKLAEAGTATMGMAEIRAWVTNLKAHALDPLPSIEAPRVTRLGADEVLRSLYQHLGLDDDDFYQPASNYSIEHKSTGQQDGDYPISSPDAVPAPYESLPVERYASLGGGSAMFQTTRDASITPSFLGSITQVAQRWCALGLDKPGTSLLPQGTTTSTTSAEPELVKAVIRRWFLTFHAVDASPAEIDALFDTVFVPLETESGSPTAYVGLCSYFVRHPHFILY
ncbi:MAG: hypothetical protein KC731_02785 [Myxococcales bacterium]|nr:hypothetical protein [Myxococcales bacterium]